MKLEVNGRIIESDNAENCVRAAIESFYVINLSTGERTPPSLEAVRVWALSHLNEWRGEMKRQIPLSDYLFSQLSYVAKQIAVQENKPQHVHREARMRGLSDQQMLDLITQAKDNWSDKNDLVEAVYIGMSVRFNAVTSIEELAQHLASLPVSLTECEAFYASEWPE